MFTTIFFLPRVEKYAKTALNLKMDKKERKQIKDLVKTIHQPKAKID